MAEPVSMSRHITRAVRVHAYDFLVAGSPALPATAFHIDDRRDATSPETTQMADVWLRLTVQTNARTRQLELGLNPRFRITGVATFQIFGRANVSADTAAMERYAALLEGQYTSRSIPSALTNRNVTFFAASADYLGIVKGSQQINVVCPFYFDYQKSDLP